MVNRIVHIRMPISDRRFFRFLVGACGADKVAADTLPLPPPLPPPVGGSSKGSVPSPQPKALRALMQPNGITSRVRKVDTMTPNIRVMAMPLKIGSVSMNSDPSTRANAVMTIGLVLVLQARITASLAGCPRATISLE